MAKMLRLVCALALGFWLVGCDNIKTQKVYWDDGKTLRAEYSYVIEKNGVAPTICSGVNMIPEARLKGPYKCYYKNGAVEKEGKFADDGKGGWMKVGVQRYYYENGQLRSEDNYNSKGKRVSKSWYENGQLRSEGNYNSKGGSDGIHKSWYKNGQLESEVQYKNGQKNGVAKSYYENGILKTEIQYKKGWQDGYERKYNKSGILIEESFYKAGEEIKQ